MVGLWLGLWHYTIPHFSDKAILITNPTCWDPHATWNGNTLPIWTHIPSSKHTKRDKQPLKMVDLVRWYYLWRVVLSIAMLLYQRVQNQSWNPTNTFIPLKYPLGVSRLSSDPSRGFFRTSGHLPGHLVMDWCGLDILHIYFSGLVSKYVAWCTMYMMWFTLHIYIYIWWGWLVNVSCVYNVYIYIMWATLDAIN